jgi:hypothetical protein
VTTQVKQRARQAEDSDAAEWGARAGLVARGLMWTVIGVLAAQIALGDHETADHQGALHTLKEQPLGAALLVLLALAFTAHAVYRLLEGTVGRREEKDEHKRWVKRAWSLCRVVAYGALAVTTVKYLVAGGSGEDASKPTATVMNLPAGQLLVGLVGVGTVVGGVAQGVRGLREDFTKKLKMPSGPTGSAVRLIGTAGLVGRGLVYVLLGSFLVQSAVTFDPDKAKGLDESLKTLARQPFGTALLLVAVVSLLSFGIWSFAEARYRRV